MTGRIGFCCKWLSDPSECGGMKVNAANRELNGRSTTMRWLREHADQAEQRQWDIMNHNARAALNMVETVGALASRTQDGATGIGDVAGLYRAQLESLVAAAGHATPLAKRSSDPSATEPVNWACAWTSIPDSSACWHQSQTAS
jgi:hypothetical protein